MADNLGQEIIWKYETPLQGRYLAAYTYGGIRPGLVQPLAVEQMEGPSTLIIPPFQAFLIPSNHRDSLIKINQTLPVTLTISVTTAVAVGLTYVWEQDSTRLAEFEVLNASQLLNYNGIILCLFDRETRRVYNQIADFTNEYWASLGMTGTFFRPTMPRDAAFNMTTFQFSTSSGIAEDYSLTVQYIYGADTLLKIANPELTIDLSTQEIGKYYLLGWKKTYDPFNPIPAHPPLEIIGASADAIGGLQGSVDYHILAVVYWTGIAATSTVYQMLAGGVGAEQAQDPGSASYKNMTIQENGSDSYRIYMDEDTLTMEYREDPNHSYQLLAQLNHSTLLAQFHTYDRNAFFGLGDRWYADHYLAAIGEMYPDILKGFWWHCNLKGQTFNGTTIAGLIGNNPTADSQNLFPDAVPTNAGESIVVEGESVPIPTVPLSENNAYWARNHRCMKIVEKGNIDISSLFSGTSYRMLTDFWCLLTEKDSSIMSFLSSTTGYVIELGQTGDMIPYNLVVFPVTVPPTVIVPDHEYHVTTAGTYYQLNQEPTPPGSIVYLYLDDSVTEPIEVFFENNTSVTVRVQMDPNSWVDVPGLVDENPGRVIIHYIPGDPNPFAYGLLPYNEPDVGEPAYNVALGTRLGVEVRDNERQIATVDSTTFPVLGEWHHIQAMAAFEPNLNVVVRVDDILLELHDVPVSSTTFALDSVVINNKERLMLIKELLTASLDNGVDHPEQLPSYTAKLPWADVPEGSSPNVLSLITGKKDLRTDIFDVDAFKTAVEGILSDHHLI